MPRLFAFLMGVVVGALLCHGATNYHVIRAQDGFHVVQKVRAHLSEAYVDVRSFGVGDWSARPELVAAITQQSKQHLMEDAATNSVSAGVNQYLPNWSQQ